MAASPLIDAAELRALVDAGTPPVLLDVRWKLGATDHRDAYLAGHVPGARFVDLETDLAGPRDPAAGRHPLPDPATFAARAAAWGIGADDAVVAYDDNGGLAAARLWWLLRWIGHERVQVLDGGLGAWRAAGGDVEVGDVTVARAGPDPAPPVSHRPAMGTVSAEQVAAGTVGPLLDARAGERYRGELEPVDPVAGHIPGALSAPTTDNLLADGRFADPDTLRRRFTDLGLTPGEPAAVYCGSGVTAAHEILALEVAGFPGVALYPASWSGWVSDPDHPVATI
ncbi:MAG: sulfurtransferase [Ilumatobacteraceae bacterium]